MWEARSIARRQADDWRTTVGIGTAAASLVGFALCGSHASLVLRARRPDDPPLVSALVWTSIATAAFDTLVGDAALLGIVEDVSDGFVRFVAVVLVVMVLSTALPPLLRRVAGAPTRAVTDAFGSRAPTGGQELTLASLADEIAAAAGRLDAAQTPADVQREAAALRELAARARV